MKIYIYLLILACICNVAFAQELQKEPTFEDLERLIVISRFGGSLREQNVNDVEVREIVSAVKEINPGSIVNIDGVKSDCPCEDGPGCTAQVWVVAYQPQQSDGYVLSKIDGNWIIGPVQKWWLKFHYLFDQLDVATKYASPNSDSEVAALQVKISELWSEIPACENKQLENADR